VNSSDSVVRNNISHHLTIIVVVIRLVSVRKGDHNQDVIVTFNIESNVCTVHEIEELSRSKGSWTMGLSV